MNLSEFKNTADVIRSLGIQHREYVRVLKEFHAQLALAGNDTVVMLVGPTRTGKSSICKEVENLLASASSDATGRFKPVVRVEAATTQDGKMSMKHLTERSLVELGHPLFKESENPEAPDAYVPRHKLTESYMRIDLERAIRVRRTRWYLVDEAHQLLRGRTQSRAKEVLDSFKSLGNATGAAIGFVGGYELLGAGLASAHLNGRMRIVHFPPYGDTPSDIDEFDRILHAFDQHVPRARGFSLMGFRNDLYDGSLGCTGLVSEWITAAMAHAASRDADGAASVDFRETRLEAQLEIIRHDMRLATKLFKRVGFQSDRSHNKRPASKGTSRLKPGERKPSRDPGPSSSLEEDDSSNSEEST